MFPTVTYYTLTVILLPLFLWREEGNLKAEKRAEAIRLMLPDFGLEEERFRLEWVSAAEGARFAQVVREFTEQVQKLGASPYRTS
jgi:F420-non-reducing hydrogenase iron-sulfur subunit